MPVTTAPTVEDLRRELSHLRGLDRSEARTMPSAFYTSEAFLDMEKDAVFRAGWVCLGHVGEIPNPGDYFTTELVGEQIRTAFHHVRCH